MKTGFSVFLAAFVALGASWFGLVYGPLKQLGGVKQTFILQTSDNWPVSRTGDATLGLQVYRSAGCVACHTEQVRQTGVANQIVLTDLAGHPASDLKEILKALMVVPALNNYSNVIVANVEHWDGKLPVVLYAGDDAAVLPALGERLKSGGLKVATGIVASGADMDRGLGTRQSVATDYLYDQPVQLGSLRVGRDLTLTGVRQPDINWHLQHLYAPGSLVKGSTMPPFRFLFEVRPQVNGQPSPDALVLPQEFAPPAGMDVLPTAAARQLAAYLVSLRANAPLYEAPFTPLTAAK